MFHPERDFARKKNGFQPRRGYVQKKDIVFLTAPANSHSCRWTPAPTERSEWEGWRNSRASLRCGTLRWCGRGCVKKEKGRPFSLHPFSMQPPPQHDHCALSDAARSDCSLREKEAQNKLQCEV